VRVLRSAFLLEKTRSSAWKKRVGVTDPKSRVRIVSKLWCGSSARSPLVAMTLSVNIAQEPQICPGRTIERDEVFVVTRRQQECWWGKFSGTSHHIQIRKSIRIFIHIFVGPTSPSYETTSRHITMVKKRIRDPEVLEEAPRAKSQADDSGSDEVCLFSS
jgi:hypothetical protein